MIRPSTLLLIIATLGCGGSSNGPDPAAAGVSADTAPIFQLLDDFNEKKSSQQSLKQLFATAPPANWKQYDKYDTQIDGQPTIDGDTATAKVKLRQDDGTTKSSEWTFVRSGVKWKIKNAPLP